MAILKNCEIWFLKADPTRPNAKFDKKNPTWEVQLRTTSKEVKKEWEALKLKVTPVDPDEGPMYYRVNLKKKQFKEDGSPSSFVEIVNGKKEAIDPNTVGNGSIAHVRIFQYDYKNAEKSGTASILMGLQLVKHVMYKPRARDDEWGEEETEVINPDGEDGESFGEETTSTVVEDSADDTNNY